MTEGKLDSSGFFKGTRPDPRDVCPYTEVIIIKFIGIRIETKEERRKREEETLYHYFRYGAKHRNKIGKLLEELVPGEKREHLIMYYLQIKDAMEAAGTQDFDGAVKQIHPKRRIISVNKTIHQYYKEVMEADANMKEDLELPTAEEIRDRVISL